MNIPEDAQVDEARSRLGILFDVWKQGERSYGFVDCIRIVCLSLDVQKARAQEAMSEAATLRAEVASLRGMAAVRNTEMAKLEFRIRSLEARSENAKDSVAQAK